jgi:hypothetical protein
MKAQRRSILPPNSTALEQAIDQGAPAWDDIANAFPPPSAPQDSPFAHWLAAELGLGTFAPYFQDIQSLLIAGRPWLLERGSAAAVLRALGWIGFDGAHVDMDGAYLHIALPRWATEEEISRIAHVVRASIPAHVRAWRVYHGWDMRAASTDRPEATDDGLLDDDSGVWVPVHDGAPIKASFGLRKALKIEQPCAVPLQSAQGQMRRTRLDYDDRATLDIWELDSAILIDAFSGLGALHTAQCETPQTQAMQRADGEAKSYLCSYDAPAMGSLRQDDRGQIICAPVAPQRMWKGAWAKPWRSNQIHSKRTTEKI